MVRIVGFSVVQGREPGDDHQFFCLTDDGEVFHRAGSEWYAVFAGGTLRDRMQPASKDNWTKEDLSNWLHVFVYGRDRPPTDIDRHLVEIADVLWNLRKLFREGT